MTITASQEVFDSHIKPFGFTRLGFGNDFAIVFSERDIHISKRISCNMNLFDFTLNLTVQRKTIPMPVHSNTICRVVSFLSLSTTDFFQLHLFTRERHAFVFLTLLKLRASSFERPHFFETFCQTLKHILKTPRVWYSPVCVFLQCLEFRQVL